MVQQGNGPRLATLLMAVFRFDAPKQNRVVDGATHSKRIDRNAFDIAMTNHDPVVVEAAARAVGFLSFGFYPRSGFLHVNLGPARSWGEPFPVRVVPFSPETPPMR